jgi:hypothetical protein
MQAFEGKLFTFKRIESTEFYRDSASAVLTVTFNAIDSVGK